MKIACSAVLAALLITSPSTFAADPIFLSVSYKIPSGSEPRVRELGLGFDEINQIARAALENKGWKVVHSASDAIGGAEVKIDVTAVQNVGSGAAVGFAVAIGMYGVSNGSSSVSNVKRVAFNYSSNLAYCGGTYDFCVHKIRKDVAASIEKWIASTF